MTGRRHVAGALVGAVAIAGCGSGADGAGNAPPAPGTPVVELNLRHSVGDEQLLACSLVHHYKVYKAGSVAFVGSVSPAPAKRWKVKVKIKRCVDGQFQDSGSDRVLGTSGGRFSGALQAPGKGVFFARARYRSVKGDVLSDKVYFEVK